MRLTCLEEIHRLAKKDARVVFIGSDIGCGTLEDFKIEFPNRFYMEGVSEGNLVSVAAGLALTGKVPYLNTIATFITRRCYEQILLDVGLQRLNVRLIGSGGGVVYAPLGPSHLAIDDIGVMRMVPNMTILAPCDGAEMKTLMPQTLEWDGPIYIRLAKGNDPTVSRKDFPARIGKAILLRTGSDVLLVSTGVTTKTAVDAHIMLQMQGISAAVLHVHTLKPFDKEVLLNVAESVRAVITIEEHSVIGGLGSIVAEILAEAGTSAVKKFTRIGIPDACTHKYGSQGSLMEFLGITPENVTDTAAKILQA